MNGTVIPSILSGSLWQIIGGTSWFGALILGALLFMSVVSWVIVFHKWRQYRMAIHADGTFMQGFHRSQKLAESVGKAKAQPASPLAHIFLAGYNELVQLGERKNQGGALQEASRPLDNDDFEIVEMTMEKTLTEQMGFLERHVIFLATTGNSAPFMGLLGTVVGIMDSFWSIGERGSASLAVVAPGIAEALLATIVGLGAAIPAVMAFNWANAKMKTINDAGNNFMLEFVTRARKEAV